MNVNTLIEARNISYSAESSFSLLKKNSTFDIIKNVSFELYQGEILGIVGESGCGKTTLAKIISGVTLNTSGEIKKHLLTNKISPIQILFQNSEELINPFRKCRSILNDASNDHESLTEVLSEVNADKKLLNSWGYQLSGGERQRIALARLLVVKPEILILDEPFSAQDYKSKINFIELLRNINRKQNITIICITHELDLLNDFVNRIMVMYKGKIIETSITNNFSTSLKHPYSQFLLESGIYKIKREDFKKNISQQPTACEYYERCDKKSDKCISEVAIIQNDSSTIHCNHPY